MAMFKCTGVLFGRIAIYTTANATVTATIGSKSYYAIADSSGYAVIKVGRKGDYSITSTGTTRVGHATVSDNTLVTAVYYWGKYNCGITYAERSTGISVSEQYNNMLYGTSMYTSKSGYTFNTSTGNYTLKNPYAYPARDNTSSGSDCYYYSIANGTSGTTMVKYYKDSYNPYRGDRYTSGNWLQYYLDPMARPSTYYKYDSTYTYWKDTFIEIATSSNIDSYPTNARHSDGYWYVAQ